VHPPLGAFPKKKTELFDSAQPRGAGPASAVPKGTAGILPWARRRMGRRTVIECDVDFYQRTGNWCCRPFLFFFQTMRHLHYHRTNMSCRRPPLRAGGKCSKGLSPPADSGERQPTKKRLRKVPHPATSRSPAFRPLRGGRLGRSLIQTGQNHAAEYQKPARAALAPPTSTPTPARLLTTNGKAIALIKNLGAKFTARIKEPKVTIASTATTYPGKMTPARLLGGLQLAGRHSRERTVGSGLTRA